MSGNATGGTSFYNLSGTAALSVATAGTRDFDIGGNVGVGDFDATFAIAGDSATVTLNNSVATLRSSAIMSFTLGATGVDAIDTTANFNLQTGAELVVDGSSYTGGVGAIPLFSYGSRSNTDEFTTETITGFTGFDTDIVYSDTGIDLLVTVPGAPAVTSFTADATSIDGDTVSTVTLTWETINATSLTLNPGMFNVTGMTEFDVSPISTTTYTLIASNGPTSASAELEIIVTPEIDFFDIGPGSGTSARIALGGSAALEWNVLGTVTDLTITPRDSDGLAGAEIDVLGETNLTVEPTETTIYTLTAENDGTSVTREYTVIVGPLVSSFVASPSVVVSGDDTTLSWTVEDFETLTLDPGGNDVSAQTSFPVQNVTEETTYTLTAVDSAGNEAVATLTVSVISANPPVPSGPTISVNFHANDVDALAEHQVEAGETAGFVPVDGASWTNINVGAPAAQAVGPIFPSTILIDDTGNTNAATIAPSVDSTFFVGYAASAATTSAELDLAGNDDDLFNSYLALNGPSGDGTPADAAVLNISGLGPDFTSGGYTVIIYSDSDRRGGGTGNGTRQSLFTLTPAGGGPISSFVEDDDASAVPNTFGGSFVFSDGVDDGADYSNFTFIEGLSASSFSLEVTSPDGGGRGAISGFQIVGGTGIINRTALILCIENAANGADLELQLEQRGGRNLQFTREHDPRLRSLGFRYCARRHCGDRTHQ